MPDLQTEDVRSVQASKPRRRLRSGRGDGEDYDARQEPRVAEVSAVGAHN